MKRILHISKYYYPYYGGIEDVAYTVVKELEPYYEQRVLCFNHKKGMEYDNSNKIIVQRVNAPATIASQPISLVYLNIIKDTIKEFRPDYIHLHLPNPLIASYLLSINLQEIKIISHWHADILKQIYLYPLYKNLEYRILKKSYKIIATSKMYAEASKSLAGFKEKTIIIPNTVNEDKFKLLQEDENEIERIKQQYEGKKIVFFVGRHVAYKGIEYLIKAEPYLDKNCVVVIAGTGELTENLKNLAKGKDRIKFVGRLSNDELKYYLYASTVFAFPSVTRQEAFGVALAEALYCGLPAVSFNIEGSGANWVNKDKFTGIVVQNRNSKDYANALNQILASDDLRNEYSNNAKQWVHQNFLKNQITNSLQLIYR